MNDEDDVWVSREGSGDEDDDGDEIWEPEDPTFFRLGLTPEGQKGQYHVRRGGDQKPRAAIPSFDSGSKVRPAFRVSCDAKLIIHGTMDERGRERATLLVHDFKFMAHGSGCFTEATVQLEFRSLNGRHTGPLVQKMAPFGSHEMSATSRGGGGGGGGGGRSTVGGIHPANEWGDSAKAEWKLRYKPEGRPGTEQKGSGGIPWRFRTCVLLKRGSDDDFGLVPIIKAKPNLGTLNELTTGYLGDKPIVYDPRYDPFNELGGSIGFDRWNLGSLDLNSIWGWDYRKPENLKRV